MMKNTFTQNDLTGKEMSWGARYLLFQTVFLPSLLNYGNSFLPVPLSAAWLNALFFTLNLVAALWIFRHYLLGFFPIGGRQLLKIFLFGILFFAINQGCSRLLHWLFSAVVADFSNVNDATIAALTRENFLLMTICSVLFVPVAEECFFRGLLFRGLYRRAPWVGWTISVFLFSFLHVMNYIGALSPLSLGLCFLQYVPAGLCLAAAYRLSGSLLCPILIHAAVNAAGILKLR